MIARLRLHSVASLAPLAMVGLIGACSSSNDHPPPAPAEDSGTADSASDAPADAPFPWGAQFADPSADTVPSGLAPITVYDGTNDVAPDFSCLGQAQPVGKGTPIDTVVHLIQFGGDDSSRVEGVTVEVFANNAFTGTPDMTPTSSTATMPNDPNRGTFTVKVAPAWFAIHIAPTADAYESWSQDLPTVSPSTAYAAERSMVDALHAAITGLDGYTPSSGSLIALAVDCQDRPLRNVVVSIEVDGALVVPKTSGPDVVRWYLSDAQFPEAGRTWTSRSGVAVFTSVPAGKSVRVAARGVRVAGGPLEYVGVRSEKVTDGAVTSSRLLPYVSVAP
jgi:hypothetical protein